MPTYAKRNGMRKAFCFLLVLLPATSFLAAQAPKSSLLWEVSGNGLKEPSHIFGTMHIMCKEDFPLSDILKNKIRSSGLLYEEINMSDPGIASGLLMKMMSAKSLQSSMSGDDFIKLGIAFQKITGLPIEAFNQFKPSMCLSTLAGNSISCNNKVVPEIEFMNLAKQYRIPLRGLETIDEQMKILDKEPLDSQINSLKRTVFNFDSIKVEMQDMIHVYKKRDIDSIYAAEIRTGDNIDFRTELLDKRNENWVPVIKKAMAEKASFFAVGAAHLGGPEGVISLLRKQGYTLKPLMF